MNLLWLSAGLFKDRYGQQNYEFAFFKQSFLPWSKTYHFKVLLLNDVFVPADACLPELKFICCGNRLRPLGKLKFVLLSFLAAIKDRPGLIICGHINLSFLCSLFLHFFKIKYVLLAYGMDVWEIKSRLKLIGLKHAHMVVCMSNYTSAKIREQLPSLDKKIFVIPGFVDTQMFSPSPKPTDLIVKYKLDDSKVILTVARLSCLENKGYERIIRLLPNLIKLVPQIKYLIVGAGDDMPNVKRLVNDLGLAGYVILTGFVPHEDLAPYYNLCDCFLMPSIQEGFGMVYVEALACGKPVIAGNLDGSREPLLDGKLGLLINPDDLSQITEAIVKVLKGNVDSRLLDVNFLRQAVIENFGLERFRQRVSEALSYISS